MTTLKHSSAPPTSRHPLKITTLFMPLSFALLIFSFTITNSVLAETYEDCVIKQMLKAEDNATVGQIKDYCRQCTAQKISPDSGGNKIQIDNIETPSELKTVMATNSTVPENDIIVVKKSWLKRFTESLGSQLTPYRANYFLPITYNSSPNGAPFGDTTDQIDHKEIKFQVSLKYQLVNNVFGKTGNIYVAYTGKSFWQAYNEKVSSPFRETNHEPEAWLSFDTDWQWKGVRLSNISTGINHQSNGQTLPLSRSWNRVFAEFMFETDDDFWVSIKPWYRLPEDKKESPDDPTGDDNPNMEKYYGYGELKAHFGWYGMGFNMMLRNNLRSSGNKGGVELGWTFPIYKEFKGYVQYYNGYGESLIDYDVPVNRIGAGFLFSEWN